MTNTMPEVIKEKLELIRCWDRNADGTYMVQLESDYKFRVFGELVTRIDGVKPSELRRKLSNICWKSLDERY